MTEAEEMATRIEELMNYSTDGVRKTFAEKVGWSKQYLNKVLAGESIGLKTVTALLRAFPEVSARWLIFGEGAMIEAKHRIMGLLQMEQYIPVMTPEQICELTGGQTQWSKEVVRGWEDKLEERNRNREELFARAYAIQPKNGKNCK